MIFKPENNNLEFDLQLFNDGDVDVDTGGDAESLDTTGTDIDTSTEEVSTEQEIGSDGFRIPYEFLDEKGEITDPDRAKELVQKGFNHERMETKIEDFKAQLKEYESLKSNPAYQWVEKQMKSQGFDDPSEFVKSMSVSDRKKQYLNEGLSEEVAQRQAENDVRISELESKLEHQEKQEQEKAQYENFLDWYDSKKEAGVFSKDFNAKEDIPVEVWQKVDEGEDLRTAFMDHYLTNQKELTEQETLKKLNENSESSTGSSKENTEIEQKAWTPEYVAKMAREKGDAWIEANWEKIEESGYFG